MITMEMIGNGAIRNKLINKDKFAATARSATIERDQIFVAQAGQDFDFVHELFEASVVVLVESLDCNFSPISEFPYTRPKERRSNHEGLS